MRVSDITIGKTFEGSPDPAKGLLGIRTVIEIAPHTADDHLLLFRVEPGPKPPFCYTSHASMLLSEFAAWATKTVRPPARPEPGYVAEDPLPSPLLVMWEKGFYVRFRTAGGGVDAVHLANEVATITAARTAHKLGHPVRHVLDSRTPHGGPHLIHGLS